MDKATDSDAAEPVYENSLRSGTGIPVRGPKDLPVSRRAVSALPRTEKSTGGTPVGLMGETPMPRFHTCSEPQAQAGKPVLIVKLNDTLGELARRRGELPDWIAKGLHLPAGLLAVVDPRSGAELPSPRGLAGVVVTGSTAMVTDLEDWSQRTAAWLRGVLAADVPVLGICYGHQLLAHAMGGQVDYNPKGREFGTVEVRLLPAAADDPLLSHLPPVFRAQASHYQSVLRLPPGAVLLAANDHDRHYAFRLGRTAWGVQFHPEFDADIVRTLTCARAESLRADGLNPETILAAIEETPHAASVLARFGQIAAGGPATIH